MKKVITLICAVVIGVSSFAQKNEIKAIEKALKSNNFATAKSVVNAAESLLGNMDDKTKAKFYFLKAQSLYANGAGTNEDISTAITSLNDLKDLEFKMGKLKYTEQANEIKSAMLQNFLTKADKAYADKKFDVASNSFYKAYQLSPKDTTYLYYAASAAINGQDYDTALEKYIQLKDMGYTGIKTVYYATNTITGKEESFVDKTMRDFSTKSNKYEKPRSAKSESKFAEIVKNIALIYVFQNKNELALAAIEEAKAEVPDDYNLVLSEGNIYLELGNREKAFELFKKALDMDKTNPDLNYNVGVLSMNSGDNENAKLYFENTLKLKPDYTDAAINLSTLSINSGNAINDEMNKLGMSEADNRKYEDLKNKKNSLFSEGAEILEKFMKENDITNNLDIFLQLKSIYGALGNTEKLKAMKQKIEEIEAKN